MRKKIILGLLLGLLISCKMENKSLPVQKNTSDFKNEVDTLFFRNDTIISIKKVSNNASIFNWGIRNKYMKTSIDTIPFSVLNKEKIKFTDKYAYIKDACGSGCNYIYVMPFDENGKDFFELYPLLYDFKKDIVIYKSDNKSSLLTIQNIFTGYKEEFIEDYDRTTRPETLAIDSISLNNNILFVKWFNADKEIVVSEIDINKFLERP